MTMRLQTLQATEDTPIHAAPAGVRRIVLTGFMGAGKTTTGCHLATRLNWNFLDLDAHLESRAGLCVPEIFARHGEDHFRRLESSALASALALPNTVLALGGGTPEFLTNRLLLEQTPGTLTIFLDAPFPVLFDRCVLQSLESQHVSRPVLADPILAQARFDLRQPLYRRLARHTIDTSTLDSADTADAILHALSSK
jgi:shikimate kinase